MNFLRPLCCVLVAALILQGCAGAPAEPPKIERISAEQLEASLPPPLAAVSLPQIVALAREGHGAEEIIVRIVESGSRYRLSASDIVALARDGVPLRVLDHLVAAERTRIFDELAADATRREAICRERIARELQLCRAQLAPMWFPNQPFINCIPSPPGSQFWRCL